MSVDDTSRLQQRRKLLGQGAIGFGILGLLAMANLPALAVPCLLVAAGCFIAYLVVR